MNPRTPILAALAALWLAAPSQAQDLVSFENALGNLRQQVLTAKAEQADARSQALANDLQRLSFDIRNRVWDVQRQRNTFSDLRRRAQRMQRKDKANQPGQNNDPFFRNDLTRFVWDLQNFSRETERQRWELDRIFREASAAPELVNPVRMVQDALRDMSSQFQWLESDVRMGVWDIRRAGFSMEAWDIEREVGDLQREIRDMEALGRRLLDKVQTPRN